MDIRFFFEVNGIDIDFISNALECIAERIEDFVNDNESVEEEDE